AFILTRRSSRHRHPEFAETSPFADGGSCSFTERSHPMTRALTCMFALCAAAGVARADGLLVNGAGATFPFPLYSKWFNQYNQLHPELKFNYQSIGSGGGVKQITEKTVDFGASDAPLTDAELQKAPGVLHIPTVLGAVAGVYSGAPEGVKLTPDAL